MAGATWQALSDRFYLITALSLCREKSFKRFQALKPDNECLETESPPLLTLFISHRWENSEHPDRSGRQITALQKVLQQIPQIIRALFYDREERLSLVPDLEKEGSLQAEELARRMMGFGPFADDHLEDLAKPPRQAITGKFDTLDAEAFDTWLLSRIVLWLDYSCVPQLPRNEAQQAMFDNILSRLDQLLEYATVISLRSEDDDYSERGWCVGEVWLGARRSFSRSLFIDMNRVNNQESILIPPAPDGTLSNEITQQGYYDDLNAFRDALLRWKSTPGLLKDIPPDPWSAYRSLQGSAMLSSEIDHNPGRRGVELVRHVSTLLIRQWWMSETSMSLNLADFFDSAFDEAGLDTTEPSDKTYLGLMLMKNGWLEVLRPLFDECLTEFLLHRNTLTVELQPATDRLREVLKSIRPNSPEVWFSRISQKGGHSREEKTAIEMLVKEMEDNPLTWQLV